MLSEEPRVKVLGPVSVDGADPGGARARALVAALALADAHAPRPVSALTDDLWGDAPPAHPRAALQSLVSRTRGAVGDVIGTEAGGYRLRDAGGGAYRSDLELARASVDAAEAALGGRVSANSASEDLLEHIDTALSLWAGAPGSDLGAAPVAGHLAEESARLRDRLLRLRATAAVRCGRHREARDLLHDLVASHPEDEGLHRSLMESLAAIGDLPGALSVFADFRERLRDALGVSPGSAILDLHARLLREQEPTATTQVRIGLTTGLGDLIGRDSDVVDVGELLHTRRLVTILGTGGLGKTRLSQAVAHEATAPTVVFVPLAGVRADADVLPAIAASLGVSEAAISRLSEQRPAPDLRDRVRTALGDGAALLILDNCEQVIDGVAAWVAEALALLPRLTVLTTSRTPLALAGETVYPLEPLHIEAPHAAAKTGAEDTPAAHGSAVELFWERALAVRPTAQLDPDTVSRLCVRLDGLPLAIELAAARVRTLTPEQIEARLADRFALLTQGDRAAPDRHRTLEAVIDWSWELLDDSARSAMAALAILPGGFSLDTAAGVLGVDAPEDLLDQLVSQSLLIVRDEPSTGGLRFRMLETVREFGIARLRRDGAEAVAWSGLRAWARRYVLARSPRLFGPPGSVGPAMFRDMRTEQENLLAALRNAVAVDDRADVVLIFAALAQGWVVRGAHTELAGIAEEVIDVVAHVHPSDVHRGALVIALVICSVALVFQQHPGSLRCAARARMIRRQTAASLHPFWRAAIDLVEAGPVPDRLRPAAAQLLTDPAPVARLVGELASGQLAENDGHPDDAFAGAVGAWHLALAEGELWLAATAASSAAQLASQSARPEEALVWMDRATEQLEAFGAEEDLRERGWLRGMALISLGRADEVRSLFADLTRDGPAPEHHETAAIGWNGIAEIRRAEGDPAGAIRAFERGVADLEALHQRATPWSLISVAALVAAASLDGSLPSDDVAPWAARMRTRTLAFYRVQRDFADLPVLGCVLTGWSAWALAIPEHRERGLEALALAEVLGARQDQPSLRLADHRDRAARIVGDAALASARAAAATVPSDARVTRALEVLGSRS
ncbi:hypothetical protein K8P10_001328 [Leucobacter sp. Psy1]|uniref:ATP-binding protein n=1 Tax=Leucobacter sp. Psy1 TaxID=2875729 RepID=UPI001CD29C91|nr:BTAD domain-containing putative transcriptional regulator [Leucobacter sp. Psy1]UBH05817.1 hypothetical protein K8P10_001328 [Leucobacter sp. Psy1]